MYENWPVALLPAFVSKDLYEHPYFKKEGDEVMNYKMGILGFGWMGYKHARMIIPKNKGIEVISAFDIDPRRLELAEQMGIIPHDDFEEFISDEKMDIVLISTPNHLHMEYARKALEAGKHVICEKPAVLHSPELEELIRLAEQKNRVFTVHQNRRWDKDFLIVKKVFEDRKIGRPVIIESRVQGANGIPSDWRRQRECGGGMLYDWGVHLIDQLLILCDKKVVSVYANLLNINYDVDDNVRIVLVFEDGVMAQIEVTTMCFQYLPRWKVIGTEGTLRIENWECEGKIVKGKVKEVDWSIEAVKNAAGFTRTMRPRPENTVDTEPLPEIADRGSGSFYDGLISALKGDKQHLVKMEETLRTAKVIDACFKSAATGDAVHCMI